MKKFLMIVGCEYPVPGLGNWNYSAAFVPEEIAAVAALNPSNRIYEVQPEEEERVSAMIKAALDFQLWANAIFHTPPSVTDAPKPDA